MPGGAVCDDVRASFATAFLKEMKKPFNFSRFAIS
jgi:hypothetical protein